LRSDGDGDGDEREMRVIREESVTYHLNEDTAHDYNSKDICTNMCQLIVPRKGQFESNTKALLYQPLSISYPSL
jgi:hypothetical protein